MDGTASAFPGLDPTGILRKQERLRSESPPFLCPGAPGVRSLKQHPSVPPTPFPPAAPTPPRSLRSASEGAGVFGAVPVPCRRRQQEVRHLGSRPAGLPYRCAQLGANPSPRPRRLPRGAPSFPRLTSPSRAPPARGGPRGDRCSPGEGRVREGRVRRGARVLSSSVASLTAVSLLRATVPVARPCAVDMHPCAHTHPRGTRSPGPWDAPPPPRLPTRPRPLTAQAVSTPPSGMFTRRLQPPFKPT